MPSAPATSLLDLVLGLLPAPAQQGPDNRLALEGLALARNADGALAIHARKLEAASLRLVSGPLSLEVASCVLHDVAAVAGPAGLQSLQAARAELAGLKVHGPLLLPGDAAAPAASATAWNLGPLAAAEGTLRAEIVDAHLLFDAEVTVPLRHGGIAFGDATVEHVGPDSRMGVGEDGLYVDAPNGRSYLYRFASAPVPGVEFEQRGALLGPWVTNRGSLALQPFAEWLLRQDWGADGMGVTEQARLLFDRTAVAGDVQLGDARFAAPGVQAELSGRAQGRNTVRLHSAAVGQGLGIDIAALSVRDAVASAAAGQLACDTVDGALALRLDVEDAQVCFTLELPSLSLAGVRISPSRSSPT